MPYMADEKADSLDGILTNDKDVMDGEPRISNLPNTSRLMSCCRHTECISQWSTGKGMMAHKCVRLLLPRLRFLTSDFLHGPLIVALMLVSKFAQMKRT